MLVAIIIVIKIKSHFCHKLLISAWKRGRFQFLPAEEVEFVSVGSSLVRGNHMGCIPSPFICTRVYPAGAGTELQDKPCTSVCAEPLISLWLCGSVQVVLLSRGALCAISCLMPFLLGRARAVLCPGRAQPLAAPPAPSKPIFSHLTNAGSWFPGCS